METANLEFALYGRDLRHYAVESRYSSPARKTDVRQSSEAPICIDWDRLRALEAEPEAYGTLLTESIFADQKLKIAFLEALSVSEAQDRSLSS